MPGPFPGMDPWLESRDIWPNFHSVLITLMALDLNASLPPEFAAVTNERLYVVEADRIVVPDVAVLQDNTYRNETGARTAVLDVDEPQVLIVPSYSAREAYIEIRTVEKP